MVYMLTYANIGGILMLNVTIYSIYGSYGYSSICRSLNPSGSHRAFHIYSFAGRNGDLLRSRLKSSKDSKVSDANRWICFVQEKTDDLPFGKLT